MLNTATMRSLASLLKPVIFLSAVNLTISQTVTPTPSPTNASSRYANSILGLIVLVIIPILIVICCIRAMRNRRYAGGGTKMNTQMGHTIMGQDGQQYYNDGFGHYFNADGSRHLLVDRTGKHYFADRVVAGAPGAPAVAQLYPGQPQPYPGQPQAYPGQPQAYPGQPQPYPGQYPAAGGVPTAVAYPANDPYGYSVNPGVGAPYGQAGPGYSPYNNTINQGRYQGYSYGNYRDNSGLMLAGGAVAGLAAGVILADGNYQHDRIR
jgi:hypothetical protein